MKQCKKCEEFKKLDDFYKRKDSKDGRKYFCKNCENDYTKKWRLNLEGGYSVREKKYSIKKLYNLSVHQYQDLIKNGCEVCGIKINLHIDHDHSCCASKNTCGKCIRGVLCQKCNHAEGLLQSNPNNVLNLYNYLTKGD